MPKVQGPELQCLLKVFQHAILDVNKLPGSMQYSRSKIALRFTEKMKLF